MGRPGDDPLQGETIMEGETVGHLTQYLPLIAAVGIHDVEVPRAISIGEESDLLPVGRPGGGDVVEGPLGHERGLREPGTPRAVTVHDVYLPMVVLIVHEGYTAAIGGEGGEGIMGVVSERPGGSASPHICQPDAVVTIVGDGSTIEQEERGETMPIAGRLAKVASCQVYNPQPPLRFWPRGDQGEATVGRPAELHRRGHPLGLIVESHSLPSRCPGGCSVIIDTEYPPFFAS